ncbi:Arylsulfatase A [Alkalibacterium gilvum]|uniref:Arylsulfatase A n=1 Tax=Alkalibacterium gilvum TaxID=1130080 RepID=A0A1H6RL67_9LACT|nr:arylsulfatase [Alkalibacterium gilvum]SEI56493.1 Arylsulfatase A [Alkalibacterium gilvum]
MKDKPNIILMMVDQLRFDSIAANGHPIVSSPNLDMMAAQGYNFKNAFTAVPSCIPSRAALMTGLSQKNHGRVGYEDGVDWAYDRTLAGTFSSLGYQTECIGKMHVYPERNRLGFDHVMLHDGYLHEARKYRKPYRSQFENVDDYLMWFKRKKGVDADLMDIGLHCNSWVARPWMYEEELHPTNWIVSESIDFLKRRDPTVPFFLNMSFARPHSPLDPPEYYYNMYKDISEDAPEVNTGDWIFEEKEAPLFSTTALKGNYSKQDMDRMRRGYYGSITHIDHQIGRFLIALEEHDLNKNTVILFLSDHGDQLGEHHLFRKSYPYQGSTHIPFILYDPADLLEGKVGTIDELVELKDVFPTLVDIAADEKVDGVDGISLKENLKRHHTVTRDYIHGEHSFKKDSNQFILTKEWKYIWYPVRGTEQLFHLSLDPKEEIDESNNPKHNEIKRQLKNHLIDELRDREESFVVNDELVQLERTKSTLSFLNKEQET